MFGGINLSQFGPLQGVLQTNLNSLNQAITGIAQNISSISNNLGPNESDNTSDKVFVPKAVTAAVSWRADDIQYKKNEVFLDVIESVNLHIAPSGQVSRSEILGALKMRCFLSGMPELKLGLNDKVLFENLGRDVTKGKAVELEDVKFHQCVRLNKFETERTIAFVPPDGEYELMSYRLNTKVKPLISVECIAEVFSKTRIEFSVKAKALFKRKSTANNVEIIIHVPRDADSPTFKTNMGEVEYKPERDAIIWNIKQFAGGKEFALVAQIGLPSIVEEVNFAQLLKKKPMLVKFEIPYFTVSGLQVRYLKIVEKSGYQALPWVRYITQSGSYSCSTISVISKDPTINLRDVPNDDAAPRKKKA